MLSIVMQVLGLVGTLAPLFTNSQHVSQAIKVMTEAAPLVIQAGQDAWEQMKPAIAAVRGSGAATPEQLAELDAIEAKGDAAFDEALKKAKEEDAKS